MDAGNDTTAADRDAVLSPRRRPCLLALPAAPTVHSRVSRVVSAQVPLGHIHYVHGSPWAYLRQGRPVLVAVHHGQAQLAVDVALVVCPGPPEHLEHAAQRGHEIHDLRGTRPRGTRRAADLEPRRDRIPSALGVCGPSSDRAGSAPASSAARWLASFRSHSASCRSASPTTWSSPVCCSTRAVSACRTRSGANSPPATHRAGRGRRLHGHTPRACGRSVRDRVLVREAAPVVGTIVVPGALHPPLAGRTGEQAA